MWLGLGLLFLGALGSLVHDVQVDLHTPRDLKQVAYAGSGECLRCHQEHNASWYRTFHRTMTQSASESSVRGDFGNAQLRYFGAEAHMERDAQGHFVIRYAGPSFLEQRFEVVMTVGSRRYQQYIARKGNELVRLPVAFDLTQERWFHMNGAFLTADPEANAPLVQADFERHLTRWNDNCIFCHNVRPNPNQHGERFDSQVAEFGIACEACHGPGTEHARRNQNPLRRFSLHLGERADPSIVNPRRLSKSLSADVCGRCHGQRMTDDVQKFLRTGDPFVPGEDLALYSAPLWHDTELHGESGVFASRFWSDGTPRLTAYEYQGLLLSPCYERGELTCTSCHGMHEGDPRGQLRESKLGASMCTDCHTPLATLEAQVVHAKHGDAPPSCVSCHMPPIVYGVLSSHTSHRIEIPSPADARTLGRPDACTLCHADRSRDWATSAYTQLYAPAAQPGTKGEPSPAQAGVAAAAQGFSEMETKLFAGDPIERALAAQALGRWSQVSGRERPASLLLKVIEHDPYPVVRRFAARALGELLPHLSAQIAAFVPESPLSERTAFVALLKPAVPPTAAPFDQAFLQSLRHQAAAQAIEIGE